MLRLEFLEILKGRRNLLGFSGGVDSTALYFLLQQHGIMFDVAIVDYGVRKQSSLEVNRAKALCFWDKKRCFIGHSEPIFADFEHRARKARYVFFEEIISTQGYQNLILAHQLNDAFEWFLMQFCKGSSLLKMQGCYKRQGILDYLVVRPLIKSTRMEILKYLESEKIFYFEDFSNLDSKFLRNTFRKNFSNPLLTHFKNGIAFSLEKLGSEIVDVELFRIPSLEPFCIFREGGVEQIDRACKHCGILLSRAQREILEKMLKSNSFSVVLQHKVSVEKSEGRIFVAPFKVHLVAIPKEFKEKYRKLKIPKRFRSFLESAREKGRLEAVLSILKEI
ncbi:tRNA lysidine(34) synthetase TilS [Helicobacter turcicus]|uniref:tRNA(Ile)-lysidine synthase n=1 Tax=Helicobacter turcicus TaxID=2867412 RepID=A0ABS7JLV8_9HELI|nr:tRNA lysidine(34) synthetase TilS [Helicobacter turcicus]MBX7490361.1 tRNA lysidine(34) synthetase TilS [Helicobacter turcicus]MBX7545060.1 tRNA lysidine(34) synthetase TilS [Helicobacter turcicus]